MNGQNPVRNFSGKRFRENRFIIESPVPQEKVVILLKKGMGLSADKNYLYQSNLKIFLSGRYSALMECRVYENNNGSKISIIFQFPAATIVLIIFFSLFAAGCIVSAILKQNLVPLIGTIPTIIIIPYAALTFVSSKVEKLKEIKKILEVQ